MSVFQMVAANMRSLLRRRTELAAENLALPEPRPFRALLQDYKLMPQGEVLGGQLGAISHDVSNQNKKNAEHAHFTGLPGCCCDERTQEGHERQCCKCFADKEYALNRRDRLFEGPVSAIFHGFPRFFVRRAALAFCVTP